MKTIENCRNLGHVSKVTNVKRDNKEGERQLNETNRVRQIQVVCIVPHYQILPWLTQATFF